MSYLDDLSLIINTKDFRRLYDKTQLFSIQNGDHYRSRLTHTLEVTLIALQIAARLRFLDSSVYIDDVLIEAIAMGHDIGHTPFGHVGERALTKILLCQNDKVNRSIAFDLLVKNDLVHSFKHNINSYRILTRKDLLDKPLLKKGIRKPLISWQVLDGVLKHTNVVPKSSNNISPYADPYNLKKNYLCGELGPTSNFLTACNFNQDRPYHLHKNALTVEGQVVALADEIAQRVADLDDCVRNGKISLVQNLAKDSRLCKNLRTTLEIFLKSEDNDKKEPVPTIAQFCDELRKKLIESVVWVDTYKNIIQTVSYGKQHTQAVVVCDECIQLDDVGKELNDAIQEKVKDVIEKELSKIDEENDDKIAELFVKYHENIEKMSKGQIRYTFEDVLNFLKSRFYQVAPKTKLTKAIIVCSDIDIEHVFDNFGVEDKTKFLKDLIKVAKDVNTSSGKGESYGILLNQLKSNEEIRAKAYAIILDNIAYYIAGMTDNFACKKLAS